MGSEIIDAALNFINSTASHIFLTGKAGTGKTTFLKNLASKTHKQLAIVAPTGIAALNAGGVTIHSQFLLPFGSFLPDQSLPDGFHATENFYTASTLAHKHPLNSARKQVLRSIDLLVIDEVSMLRADLLDAIDYRLKAARGIFNQRFGGVQLLLIGDLFQLPPVVKRNEQQILERYYKSQWFYESKALLEDGFVYIEFDKIFRQKDEDFIRILNNLRNNTVESEDIHTLNAHFKSETEIEKLEEVITLTTHNNKADVMNTEALKKLKGLSYYFDAIIEGDFPESMCPVLPRLELKEGAQIMFVRNDNEDQLYFNGKIATVEKISGDQIEVRLAESNTKLILRREKWENKKYTIHTETKELEEDVIGSFEQYPVKLAWAITIHKSQGLTFDKAIIDVQQAFADGQVYVALSRLRSLEGLILRTEINKSVISTDKQIVNFSQTNNRPDHLLQRITQEQRIYTSKLIEKTFDFSDIVKEIKYLTGKNKNSAGFDETSMQPALIQIANTLEKEKINTAKYRSQLFGLIKAEDNTQLLERIEKGSAYYRSILLDNIKALLLHIQEMKQHKRVKTYLNNLSDLDQLLAKKLEQVDKSITLISTILNNGNEFDFSVLEKKRKEERSAMLASIKKEIPDAPPSKKSGRKKDGPSTYDITLEMFQSGMDIETIAKERELVPSTIEGHLAKAVESGKMELFKFMTSEEFDAIGNAIKKMDEEGFTSKDVYIILEGKFSYPKIRVVMSQMLKQ